MIRVHIDELVLDGCGVGPAQRAAVAEAVRQELAELFRVPSGPHRARAVPRLAATPVRLGPPGELGGGIARSVHGGVTRLTSGGGTDGVTGPSSSGGGDG